MDQLIAFAQTPIGAAALVILGVFAPRLYPLIAPFLNRLKNLPAAPTAPTAPASTSSASALVTVSQPIAETPSLEDSAVSVLKSLACQRYCYLSNRTEALHRYAADEIRRLDDEVKKRAEDNVKKAGTVSTSVA